MNRFLLVLLAFITFQISLFSQEIGRLPYQNFTHRDYLGHYQNWAIIQDSRGFIYSCNNSGVLEYDGNEWRKISINNVVSRSIDIDSEGRIWVGGQDQLGYLAPDSIGLMKYVSLNHLIDNKCLPFGMVRQVYTTNDGVYFSTNNFLFRLTNDSIDYFLPETFFHRTYHVFDRIFSIQPQVGLTVLANDTLVLVPGGERFNNTRIYAMLPYDNENILIATQSEGFFLYKISAIENGEGLNNEDFITPFYTSDDQFFKDNWVYHGIAMPNGWFAFGTYRGGAVIFDSNGKIIQYVGKEQGIQDETVWHLALDNQDNIWLALNNGISYFSTRSPITSWDETLGIQGVLQSVCWHKNRVYVSSNTGVFYKDGNSFNRVEGILDLSWEISLVRSPEGKEIALVGTGQGIYTLINGKAKLIKNGKVPTFKILQSKYHPNILYLGHYDGIGVAQYQNGNWVYLGRFEGVNGRVFSIIEEDKNSIWFTSFLNGIVRAVVNNPISLKFDESQLFQGLPYEPNFDEDVSLTLVNNQVKVSTTKGLAYFDSSTNLFRPDSSLGPEFTNGELGIKIFLQDDFGTLWFESYKEPHTRQIERANLGDNNSFVRLYNEFNEIPRMIFYDVFVNDDRVSWIAGSDGLFRFDPQIKSRGIRIPTVHIRKVVSGNNTVVFGGSYSQPCPDSNYVCYGNKQIDENIPQIPFKANTLSFHFASPFYGQEGKMLFSTKLEGFDASWSDWSRANHKEYTNLPFGSYSFKVKALSMYDVESPEVEYLFEIDRPWYQHPLMYVTYLGLLILIIAASVSLKTRMLKTSNLRLQTLVDERTSELLLKQRDIIGKTEELLEQKEEIESQRDILEYQNLQTKLSLEYALTIQQAILPSKKLFDEFFDSFIIYNPKDVVSGDFYWYTNIIKKNDCGIRHIIAVADCTGHGVPGAFMSMIGSRMLNEIVNERKISDPAEILTHLDSLLSSILKKKMNDNLDGMDISVCAIDQITEDRFLIIFSGANQPIGYFKKGSVSMSVVKGNRKSVGGIFPNVDKKFQNHLIDLAKGDSIFLFTDGITDQNNQFGKRYTSSRFYSLISKHIDKGIDEIGERIQKSLIEFKGESVQRDDITVIGIRLR